jgi:hypothetical protein
LIPSNFNFADVKKITEFVFHDWKPTKTMVKGAAVIGHVSLAA